MDVPVKPIDSWSRGMRRRLLMESSFDSLHQALSLEIEAQASWASDCCSKINFSPERTSTLPFDSQQLPLLSFGTDSSLTHQEDMFLHGAELRDGLDHKNLAKNDSSLDSIQNLSALSHESTSNGRVGSMSTIACLHGELKKLLLHGRDLPAWAAWLDSLVQRSLIGRGCGPRRASAARQLMLVWTYYSSLLMRELTLRSASTFGSCHLLRLLCDEYLSFRLEQLASSPLTSLPAELTNLLPVIKTEQLLPRINNGDQSICSPTSQLGLISQESSVQSMTEEAIGVVSNMKTMLLNSGLASGSRRESENSFHSSTQQATMMMMMMAAAGAFVGGRGDAGIEGVANVSGMEGAKLIGLSSGVPDGSVPSSSSPITCLGAKGHIGLQSAFWSSTSLSGYSDCPQGEYHIPGLLNEALVSSSPAAVAAAAAAAAAVAAAAVSRDPMISSSAVPAGELGMISTCTSSEGGIAENLMLFQASDEPCSDAEQEEGACVDSVNSEQAVAVAAVSVDETIVAAVADPEAGDSNDCPREEDPLLIYATPTESSSPGLARECFLTIMDEEEVDDKEEVDGEKEREEHEGEDEGENEEDVRERKKDKANKARDKGEGNESLDRATNGLSLNLGDVHSGEILPHRHGRSRQSRTQPHLDTHMLHLDSLLQSSEPRTRLISKDCAIKPFRFDVSRRGYWEVPSLCSPKMNSVGHKNSIPELSLQNFYSAPVFPPSANDPLENIFGEQVTTPRSISDVFLNQAEENELSTLEMEGMDTEVTEEEVENQDGQTDEEAHGIRKKLDFISNVSFADMTMPENSYCWPDELIENNDTHQFLADSQDNIPEKRSKRLCQENVLLQENNSERHGGKAAVLHTRLRLDTITGFT
ncbi:unnamed protein product [Protopolystoma xenopodis]|uniref:RFX1-4/6/8-like BCD domain-containing protein n=1 Tax=Protopolystoma xenopodis TaxID=117903 RepID=A0A448XAQ8_9PLAT|nr:unnamed protein product [Protopolystoma xenopodis]